MEAAGRSLAASARRTTSGPMPAGSPRVSASRTGRPSERARLELLDQVLARAQGEGEDGEGRGLVRAAEKDARIAREKVRHVVRLAEAVGHEALGVVPHAQAPRLVQAPPRAVALLPRPPSPPPPPLSLPLPPLP